MFYWCKNISSQNWNETFPLRFAAVEKQPRHSHAPSARSCPTWLSSLSHCIKCKIHCWAPTPSQEEQTEMERHDLEFSNKLELDGKTLLKQSSCIPNINLSEFTLSTCSQSGEPSLIINKGRNIIIFGFSDTSVIKIARQKNQNKSCFVPVLCRGVSSLSGSLHRSQNWTCCADIKLRFLSEVPGRPARCCWWNPVVQTQPASVEQE